MGSRSAISAKRSEYTESDAFYGYHGGVSTENKVDNNGRYGSYNGPRAGRSVSGFSGKQSLGPRGGRTIAEGGLMGQEEGPRGGRSIVSDTKTGPRGGRAVLTETAMTAAANGAVTGSTTADKRSDTSRGSRSVQTAVKSAASVSSQATISSDSRDGRSTEKVGTATGNGATLQRQERDSNLENIDMVKIDQQISKST